MTRALIVGYGRAGKRHGMLLDSFGVEWNYVDLAPVKAPPDLWVGTALEDIDIGKIANRFDLAVVCTPPDLHLAHVESLLDAGIPKVLCEKPFCGLSQTERARELAGKAGNRVCVAYNWRWHPHVIHLRSQPAPVELVHLYSSQYRPELPPWGLLLDHVAHGVDTMRQIVDGEPRIDLVFHKIIDFEDPVGDPNVRPSLETWTVQGAAGGCRFVIDEVVHFDEHAPPRQCFVAVDHVRHDLDVSLGTLHMMFSWMWRDVLTWVDEDLERPPVMMADALETQAVLERAHELNEEALKK